MYEGYCVGGSMHGQQLSFDYELYRCPVYDHDLYEIAPIGPAEVPTEMIEYNIDEYIWSVCNFPSGPVYFWRHSSIKTEEQLFALLIESFQVE